MNYLNITKCNQLNGDGLRVVLWVAGCSHHCKGCHNAYSWDPAAGIPFDQHAKDEIFAELEKDWCSGLTLTGGDPMFEGNRNEIIAFAREVKSRFPDKTIWMWTGYTYAELLANPTMSNMIEFVDVIVDGEYDESRRDITLPWRGSSNQNVLRVTRI